MRKVTALAAIAAMLASPAGATQWDPLGPRAMGMGGAQVAIAQGPLASYWNPGGLGQLYDTDGLEIPFSARGEFTGSVLQGANDLFQLNKDCNPVPNANCTQARINSALSALGQPANGVLIDGGLGANVKIGKVVAFVNSFVYAGGSAKVDPTNTTPATISSNQSKIILRGIEATEIGAGYGHEIFETGLSVGATGKLIIGRVGYFQQNVVTDNPGGGGSAFRDFNQRTKTSVRPAFDVGALWDLRETFPILPWRPRLGVVGRNLNDPKFDQPNAAKQAGERGSRGYDGQARAGAAVSPLKFWNIAADVDLTNNLTPIDGILSRYVSVGTEINIFNQPGFNIPLRAGIQKNVSQANSALAYTGGFGLNIAYVMFDLAGMISGMRTTVQTENGHNTIPNNFGFSARLAILFGGADEGARNR